MLKRTWWNSLALFLKGVLKPYLGLDLIDPRSSLLLKTSTTQSSALSSLKMKYKMNTVEPITINYLKATMYEIQKSVVAFATRAGTMNYNDTWLMS